jgi:hypothetical protein
MKMPPEDLLQETLLDNDTRAASLETMLGAVRQRKRQRRAVRLAAAASIVLAVASLWLDGRESAAPSNKTSASVAAQPVATVPGTHIRILSDAELLSMFPDRAVALIGPREDRQFVFLDDPDVRGTAN